MNILFLTIVSIEDINERGIYTDLVRELAKEHSVFVVTPRERRTGFATMVEKVGNITLLKVKTGNITKTKSLVEKGISTLLVEYQYEWAINKYFGQIKFDLVLYSTPPITFNRIIKKIKKKHSCRSYLLLKDIFPQNAVDIGLMKINSLLHRFFRNKERELYRLSDKIGCMSPANVKYVLEHNPEIAKDKLEVFPNCIEPIERFDKSQVDREILERYNIPSDKVLFVYGGSLGKPQGIDFLLEVIGEFKHVENAFLLIVGDGTEYSKVFNYINRAKPINVMLLKMLPKKDYDELLKCSDVGLIFLDKRFTIPNFPCRLTAYLENYMPLIAATDVNTDLPDIINKEKIGYCCESSNVSEFIKLIQKMVCNKEQFCVMRDSSRFCLENNFILSDEIISLIIK
ncbi:MAG: glycosyltransferase family 4 protein [Bacillota bacterium]